MNKLNGGVNTNGGRHVAGVVDSNWRQDSFNTEGVALIQPRVQQGEFHEPCGTLGLRCQCGPRPSAKRGPPSEVRRGRKAPGLPWPRQTADRSLRRPLGQYVFLRTLPGFRFTRYAPETPPWAGLGPHLRCCGTADAVSTSRRLESTSPARPMANVTSLPGATRLFVDTHSHSAPG